MGRAFNEALRNGTTATVIWLCICLWTGGAENLKFTGLGGLILLIVVTVVSTIIGTIIFNKKSAAGQNV